MSALLSKGPQSNPDVHNPGTVLGHDHRVQIELSDLRQVLSQRGCPYQDVPYCELEPWWGGGALLPLDGGEGEGERRALARDRPNPHSTPVSFHDSPAHREAYPTA